MKSQQLDEIQDEKEYAREQFGEENIDLSLNEGDYIIYTKVTYDYLNKHPKVK